jgi:hypothetical protein
VSYWIDILDWALIYFSVGLFFGVSAVASRRLNRDGKIAVLSVLFWPVFGSFELFTRLRHSDRSRVSPDYRLESIRFALAAILEAERPGMTKVRALELVDWYVDIAEAVSHLRSAVANRQVDHTPELLKISGKSLCMTSALSLEIRALNKALKHLRLARASFVEKVMENSLISASEESRRVALLLDLAILCDDRDETIALLDKNKIAVESKIRISDNAETATISSH